MKKILICLGVFVVSSCTVEIQNSVDSIDDLSSASIIGVSQTNSIISDDSSSVSVVGVSNTGSIISDINSNGSSSVTSRISVGGSSNSVSQGTSTSIHTSNPYTNTDRDSFYYSYQRATSASDALFRSESGLMSGNIAAQGHYPNRAVNAPSSYGLYQRAANAEYTFDKNGEYASYTINTLDKKNRKTIYYGGAYTSLEEVAAYLLAFGEVPPNSKYDKSYGRNDSISKWGEYGRVNFDYFSNDVSKYPYEPSLASVNSYDYIETDFGTVGGYYNGSYYQALYNDGYSINRGAARLVFTSTYSNGSKITDIDDRHVFYTYNHYNDFQEYLNYEGGWGERFGFETAGNPYCYNTAAYNEMYSPNPPTEYPSTLLFTI